METHKRSVAKAISFRIIATIATMAVVLLFMKDFKVVGLIGGIDLVSKLLIYYLHERAWEKINWGRKLNFRKAKTASS